jgi:glycosyl transferase, family 25
MIIFLIIFLILLCTYLLISSAQCTDSNNKYLDDMPVYVINLKSRPKRKERALKELNKYNIKHKFIEAVDGSKLDKTTLEDDNIIKTNGSYRELRKGEIGCYLSHLECWKNILESGKEYGLVFEDDVVLADNFIDKFNEMFDSVKNKNWDIICLGRRCQQYFKNCTKGVPMSDETYYPETLGYGTYAYIIKANAINELLKTTYPIMKPIDVVIIDEYFKKNINVLGLNKDLVTIVDVKNSDTVAIK